MKRNHLLFIVLALTAAVSFGGCGDDDDGINPGTPCEQMIYDICQAACDCNDDCAWSSASTSASSTDLETCYEMEIEFGACDGLQMDFAACSAAVDDGQCGDRLVLPVACDDVGSF